MLAKMAANGIRTHARTNQRHSWTVYMIKTKMAFFEGQLLSSQSEQSEKFSKCSDWLKKSWLSKKATFVFIM